MSERREEPETLPEGEENYPVSWFEEALARERVWLREAHDLIRQLQSDVEVLRVPADLDASRKLLEEQAKHYSSLLADGELDKANDVFMDIAQIIVGRATAIAEGAAQRTLAEFEEAFLFRQTILSIEASVPQLDPKDPTFDVDAVSDVRALVREYVASAGLTPSRALGRAVERLFHKATADLMGPGTIGERPSVDPRGLGTIRLNLTKDGRFIVV